MTGIGSAFRHAVGLETKDVHQVSAADGKNARIFSRVLGLGESHAGKTVTVDAAMQLSAVWACVKLTSETVATLPLMVYRRHPDGGREVAGEHPLYSILHDTLNADQTAVEFWEGVVLSLLLNGNAYAEKVKRSDGSLIALMPMPFDKTTVRRRPEGDLEYRFMESGRARVLQEDEVLHIRAFGNGGDLGLSPIAYARHSLGIATAADEAAGKLYKSGVRPSGVLQYDKILTDPQRKDVKDNIVAPLAGSANAGGVFVLEGGMKFEAISLSPKDAEMATARRWHVEEICRWFGTPPMLIGQAQAAPTASGPVEAEDDETGGGPTGRRPFDEAKAFDPSKHPRDPNGQFSGRGAGRGRLMRLIQMAIGNGRHEDNVDLGRVSGARYSGAAGRDVDGWRFGVSSQFVRHINARHGPKSGDRNPLTKADYGRLPRILKSGTVTVGARTDHQGLQGIIVTHRTKGSTYRAVLAVRKRSRSLTLHSFTKRDG